MTTRADSATRFEHLIVNVMQLEMTDDIVVALSHAGCNDLNMMGMMQAADVGRLVIPNTTTNVDTMATVSYTHLTLPTIHLV